VVKLKQFFPLDIHKMTSIYKYEYLGCNNSFSRTFTKWPTFTNMGTWNLVAFIQIIKFPNFKKNICLRWFFFLICLDIIGRVKISEYNFLCPFLSQGFTFFLDLKKIINFFKQMFFLKLGNFIIWMKATKFHVYLTM
jgi:hypothetical protein